ncbi:hypothetical protein [Bacteroides bouchesdurhonensis]|uniref:hypothetical protein n=1 Tax=Bacteroides bouchesdurhonensis TaxID=1841855 RepID=UPI0016527476|nr:hypothetical protein [Bacteroides bouchesdurhonensis]
MECLFYKCLPTLPVQHSEHPVQTSFLTNQNRQGLAHYLTFYPKLSVRIYCLSADSLTYRQDYATGTLDCTQTTDEDGHITLEFKDRTTDRVLLSRVMDGEVMLDTYYVYDGYGNLRMVLPPAASNLLTATTTPASWIETVAAIQKYAYIYKYDGRNRCIYKKLPGESQTSQEGAYCRVGYSDRSLCSYL